MYDASGTITNGGTAQLLLPRRMSCSSLEIQNISDTNMFIEIGSARATATITNGVVTSVAVTNSGFNFTLPPIVEFLGGGNAGNTTFVSATLPDYPSPSNPAIAHATLSAGSVNAIVIDNGGSGYKIAPYVFIRNSDLDPSGCATPSATSGLILLPSGGAFTANGTTCTTDPISIFCATSGKAFSCKWMN